MVHNPVLFILTLTQLAAGIWLWVNGQREHKAHLLKLAELDHQMTLRKKERQEEYQKTTAEIDASNQRHYRLWATRRFRESIRRPAKRVPQRRKKFVKIIPRKQYYDIRLLIGNTR